MFTNQASNLFQLQTELIDMKVDMAANKAIERVIDGISDLKDRIIRIDNRLVAVETKLGMVNETEKEIKARVFASQTHVQANFIEYSFKAGWLLLASITTYFLVHFHIIIK
jgi:hypothetical protein